MNPKIKKRLLPVHDGHVVFLGAHDTALRPTANVGRTERVYRLIYEEHFGPLQQGFTVDHLCGKPWCCAIEHLEVVTQEENTRRYVSAIATNRTHCSKGHEWTESNIYIRPGNGRAMCLLCMRKRALDNYHKRKRKARQSSVGSDSSHLSNPGGMDNG